MAVTRTITQKQFDAAIGLVDKKRKPIPLGKIKSKKGAIPLGKATPRVIRSATGKRLKAK